jgi:hypothetical protein
MYCVIPTPQHAGKGRTMETVKRSMVDRDLSEGKVNVILSPQHQIRFLWFSVTCNQFWYEYGKFQK